MTDSYTFKKFSKTDFLEEIPDNATLLIEDNGDIKRVPASQVGGTGVQADLTQNNPTAPDYVKGRTHWIEVIKENVLVDNVEVVVADGYLDNLPFYVPLNTDYVVVWDGTEYYCSAYNANGASLLGNESLCGTGSDTGEPFLIISHPGGYPLYCDAGTHTISILTRVENIHTIAEKYLPEFSKIGYKGTGLGSEIFNDNVNNIASGNYSHAEGNETTASGERAHAEGKDTTASGGESHAEGLHTVASGLRSHAEGEDTIASGDVQHVQGKWNIEDRRSTYAHIVGNGSSSARSNAHTLDWDGNAWYQGTVEGTAMIVKSSTSGSTKRFKITVDDSGTISATEITE